VEEDIAIELDAVRHRGIVVQAGIMHPGLIAGSRVVTARRTVSPPRRHIGFQHDKLTLERGQRLGRDVHFDTLHTGRNLKRPGFTGDSPHTRSRVLPDIRAHFLQV
jgi:hypothetical protein